MRARIVIACALVAALAVLLTPKPQAHRTAPALAEVEATQMIQGARCGVELWSVKTLTDVGARTVEFGKTRSATLAQLGALTPDSHGSRSLLEQRVYRVRATLLKVKLEDDSDYHLVLSDGSAQMIAEAPYVGCTVGAQHRYLMALARQRLEAKLGPVGRTWKVVNLPVIVRGALFFDFAHGQSGHADNYAELHPILNLSFP